jgi:VWFA-related protein
VVVRDRQGHAVSDLKEADFTVLDNGKPRAVSGFAIERRGEAGAVTGRASTPASTAPKGPDATAEITTLPERIVVFLFDDLHLNGEELTYAKKAAAAAIAEAISGSNVAAVVSISGAVNSGLTRDGTKLDAAIEGVKPHAIFRSETQACGNIDYYQADLIENKHDPVAFSDALAKETLCNPSISISSGDMAMAESMVHSTARRELALGSQDVRATFTNLAEYVDRIAKLPGQRTLILVSSGFLNVEPEAQNIESQILNQAAQANVTISSLDARGLYTSEISASERGPGAGGANLEFRRNEMRLQEDPMAELADGTGGTFFHNSNDLEAGFKALSAAPEVAYVLELSLDGVKADGVYHHLKVKVDREGDEVQARRGYPMPKVGKNKK